MLPKYPILIYYWAKLLRLAPFTLKNNRLHSATLWDKLYVIVFVVIHVALTTKSIFEEMKPETNGTSYRLIDDGLIRKIHRFLGNMSLVTPIVLLCFGNKIVCLGNKFCDISKELKSYGIIEDHVKTLRKTFVIMATVNVAYGMVITVVYFYQSDKWFLTFMFAIEHLINLNMILIFSQMMLSIGERFKLLNEKLYDHFRTIYSDRLSSTTISTRTENLQDNQRINNGRSFADLHPVEKLGFLHYKLCDLVDDTTDVFGIPICLSIYHLVTLFNLLSYSIYTTIPSLNPASTEEYSNMVKYILYAVTVMAIGICELFLIAHVSMKTCQQGNATKFVLLMVWNEFEPEELRTKFTIISHQLKYKQVVVSVFGFIDLGYSCLLKIFGVVLGDIIVMIQFRKL